MSSTSRILLNALKRNPNPFCSSSCLYSSGYRPAVDKLSPTLCCSISSMIPLCRWMSIGEFCAVKDEETHPVVTAASPYENEDLLGRKSKPELKKEKAIILYLLGLDVN